MCKGRLYILGAAAVNGNTRSDIDITIKAEGLDAIKEQLININKSVTSIKEEP
jgi:hypothetical protein